MGREKKTTLAAATASKTAKDRHQRTGRDNNAWTAPVRTDLVALPEKNITSKHKSYFQVFENHDKKEKKLELQITTDKTPPPGFEFVPIGNPELTQACKELSRERDAMIFIVCTAKDANANKLALQMSRTGHHIRRTIVEEARAQLGEEDASTASNSGEPEPIPETQEEYNAQADAALRDLFPRIPNTDRQMIIEHAFKKLLREAGYPTARKVVEQHCLDFLVKWRGDEETGRDQFDEILREVVVLSDDSDEDSEDDESSDEDFVRISKAPDSNHVPADSSRVSNALHKHRYATVSRSSRALSHKHPVPSAEGGSVQRTKPQRSKKTNRGFKRYEAVAKRWEEAVNRNRYAQHAGTLGHVAPMDRIPSQGSRRPPSVEIVSPVHRADSPRNSHLALNPLHFYHGGPNQGPPPRPNDRLPVANLDPRQHMPLASYAGPQSAPKSASHSISQSVPPEAMIVGRRITRVPVDIHLQSGPAPQRPYHEELKDYLVPSIEPASPHSGPDVPQFVRQVIRGEPRGPEQVPTGRTVPFQHVAPLQSHAGNFQYDQLDSGSDNRQRPMNSRVGEQIVTPRDYYYESQPNLVSQAPEHVRRVYRVREPLEDSRRSREAPVITSKRVIRVERGAQSAVSWDSEPPRVRDFSPTRLDQYAGRTLPSGAFENTGPRRIVYREASASRFKGYDQDPASSSVQHYQREAHWAPSIGFPQGSTFTRPDSFIPVRSAGTAVNQGPPPRPSYRGTSPVHQDVAEYQHRGRVNISYEWYQPH
ncbi:hypothetical protein N8I77_006107 [Diaporthe amygdali]|uniref:DUF2293 domain-containing protein n=1 Tax=Phomopsis amygdali TaxID=1214568 RepID=A0AAD9W691_PHOAM|nr:hypothetical protein N8I77_006107 [Diaporthe amygdali]